MQSIGRTLWAIPEGYIPSDSVSDAHDLVSHEAACFLNVGENDADVQITLFFENRDPVGPYRVKVPARRTLHLRFNDLTDPAPVPRDTSYASLIEASAPLIVQHTRLDRANPGWRYSRPLPIRPCRSEEVSRCKAKRAGVRYRAGHAQLS